MVNTFPRTISNWFGIIYDLYSSSIRYFPRKEFYILLLVKLIDTP